MIYAIGILLVIIINIIGFTIYRMKKNKVDTLLLANKINEILEKENFSYFDYINIDKNTYLALDISRSRIAIITNLDIVNQRNVQCEIIATRLIKTIEKGVDSVNIAYIRNCEVKDILIKPLDNKNAAFMYELLKAANFGRIKEKFPKAEFDIVSGSDVYVEYLWAYSSKNSNFAYLCSKNNYFIKNFSLLKENVTIDIKYNYFETQIFGTCQQLFAHENDFLSNVFHSLLNLAKNKFAEILKNKLYFDNYNDIILLTNNINSLQVIALNKVKEVYFKQDRIYFELKNSNRIINYTSDDDTTNELIEFITKRNLKAIMNKFDNSIDKLINTTLKTKLIIDNTRNRIIYCANVDTISKFNYMIYDFSSIKKVSIEGKKSNPFVRIHISRNEILDISCNKYEVAEYISILIKKILTRV